MKFGLCTISNGEASVSDVLDAAATAGYDGVEVWGKEPHVGDKTAAECEAIAAAARERSLEIPVSGSYLRPGTDEFDSELATELDVAEHLGADLIRAWAGKRDYGEHTEAHWQETVADLGTLADEADDRGLSVTVEKHAGTLTSRAKGAERLVDAVDRENLGVNFQPTFSLPGEEIASEAETLAPISNNVHVQAVPERNADDRCPLEDAYFDVDRLLSILSEHGFDGYVNVEFVANGCDYERAIERDLAYLRSCRG